MRQIEMTFCLKCLVRSSEHEFLRARTYFRLFLVSIDTPVIQR
jgi:hypothetical protein